MKVNKEIDITTLEKGDIVMFRNGENRKVISYEGLRHDNRYVLRLEGKGDDTLHVDYHYLSKNGEHYYESYRDIIQICKYPNNNIKKGIVSSKCGIKSVEFIPSRKRTVIAFLYGDTTWLVRTTYSGEVGDEGYSNYLGFLYGFYKSKHHHLNSTQLQGKMKLVMKHLDNCGIRVYLESYFLESGIVSPSKAIKILNAIYEHDTTLERVKIDFIKENK